MSTIYAKIWKNWRQRKFGDVLDEARKLAGAEQSASWQANEKRYSKLLPASHLLDMLRSDYGATDIRLSVLQKLTIEYIAYSKVIDTGESIAARNKGEWPNHWPSKEVLHSIMDVIENMMADLGIDPETILREI